MIYVFFAIIKELVHLYVNAIQDILKTEKEIANVLNIILTTLKRALQIARNASINRVVYNANMIQLIT